jgi:hypothetical protein
MRNKTNFLGCACHDIGQYELAIEANVDGPIFILIYDKQEEQNFELILSVIRYQ